MVVFLSSTEHLHSMDCVFEREEHCSDLVDAQPLVFEKARKESKIEQGEIGVRLNKITTHLALHNELLFRQVDQGLANVRAGKETVDSLL
jgi:hypothetical protein